MTSNQVGQPMQVFSTLTDDQLLRYFRDIVRLGTQEFYIATDELIERFSKVNNDYAELQTVLGHNAFPYETYELSDLEEQLKELVAVVGYKENVHEKLTDAISEVNNDDSSTPVEKLAYLIHEIEEVL